MQPVGRSEVRQPVGRRSIFQVCSPSVCLPLPSSQSARKDTGPWYIICAVSTFRPRDGSTHPKLSVPCSQQSRPLGHLWFFCCLLSKVRVLVLRFPPVKPTTTFNKAAVLAPLTVVTSWAPSCTLSALLCHRAPCGIMWLMAFPQLLVCNVNKSKEKSQHVYLLHCIFRLTVRF